MVRRSGWWKKPLLSVAAVTIVLAALEAGLRVAGFRQPPRIRSLNTPAVAGFEGTMQFLLRTQLDLKGLRLNGQHQLCHGIQALLTLCGRCLCS